MADLDRQSIIKIDVDTSGIKEGQHEVDKLRGKLDGVGDIPLDKSIKTLKQQLKSANDEAQKMFATYGNGSKEFNDAAAKAAKLKDELEEVNLAVKNFNPDNKFQ